MRHAMMILNPSSGRGVMREAFYEVIATFFRGGIRVTPYITQTPADIASFVQAAPAYDLLIIAGGDGTVNDVLNELLTADIRLPLAYIPAGTTNDLAQSLGISLDPVKAADQIIKGQVRALDVGAFQGSYFSYVAACGVFTAVSYSTSQEMKNTFGRLAYYVEGMRALGELGQSFAMAMTYGDSRVVGDFIFAAVTNSRSLGGLIHLDGGQLAVDMTDGLLEALLIRAPKNAGDLTKIAHSLSTGHSQTPLVESHQAPVFEFRFRSPQAWTLDGEYGGDHQNARVEVVPRCIDMYVP